MGITEMEQELKIIRQAMEASSRYTNVPVFGYLAAGIVGILGAWGTYNYLGKEKVLEIRYMTPGDVKVLALVWSVVFIAAVTAVIFFSWLQARKKHIAAWNSLAARMFLSQVPLIAMTGILTLALTMKGYYNVIPGFWLGMYGVILFSFSYYTGIEHRIEAMMFLCLGSFAGFASGMTALVLLGVGFGGVHLIGGIIRLSLTKKVPHESEPIE